MTNEQTNAENDAIRDKARRDAADKRVVPQSGYDPRSIQHTLYTETYKST